MASDLTSVRNEGTDLTLYEILGIDGSASRDEIRRAYRQKALETHPDKLKLDHATDEEYKQAAEARFHQVHDAFSVLSDPQKRRVYDVRMSIKADYDRKWTTFTEEQAKRMRDREEWARKAEEEYQARMKVLRQQKEAVKEEVRKRERDALEYATMVNKMLQKLYEQNPEWEARKREVRRRQAERTGGKSQVLRKPVSP